VRHTSITLVAALVAGCQPIETGDELGGQSGSLRDDPLELPDDVETLDYDQAITQAVAVALGADLATAWRGHVAMLEGSEEGCPSVFLGAPEDAMTDDEEVVSWAGTCSTGPLDYDGFVTWQTEVDEAGGGTRSLAADAVVLDGAGDVQFEFDGEASDDVTWFDGGGFSYSSSIEGRVSGLAMFGSDSAVPGGFRGNVDVATSSDGSMTIDANLYLFGEPLLGRFDSVVLDIEFREGCSDEPVGYVGLRGVDGYWFDVYFLPKVPLEEIDPNALTVEAQAYPYDIIEDPVCDGCGHLFVRNVRIDSVQQVCPDFGSLAAGLSAPPVDEYVLTLHDPPWETE
jgi:hypothetical protein